MIPYCLGAPKVVSPPLVLQWHHLHRCKPGVKVYFYHGPGSIGGSHEMPLVPFS
ncbi:unnamed protein product [Staurois parvus]|uniref:Uncharacterized protein n=1 Tax=Staurois parvus TaxID=386267 RepID=A0ABN9CEF6_9NEOB|nr:unnamed protein product [Staurois parvus]